MVKDGTIVLGSGVYNLNRKGLFDVKRNTIVPFLNLTETPEYRTIFVEKNKQNCDYLFINTLFATKTEEQKELLILDYGVKHFEKLSTLISLINVFLHNVDKLKF